MLVLRLSSKRFSDFGGSVLFPYRICYFPCLLTNKLHGEESEAVLCLYLLSA